MNFNPDRIADCFGGWVELKSGTVKVSLALPPPPLDNVGNEASEEERAVEVEEGEAAILGTGRTSESTLPPEFSVSLLVRECGVCIYVHVH